MNEMRSFRGQDDPDLLGQIETFRIEVWARLVGFEAASSRFRLDDFDYEGWHVACLDGTGIVGCARLIIAGDKGGVPDLCSFAPYAERMKFPAGFLNRLVVHRRHSGRGIGRQLKLERMELARRRGVQELWAEIESSQIASMERLGFDDVGPSPDTSIDGTWRIMRKPV